MVLLFEVDHFLRFQPLEVQGSTHEVFVDRRQPVGVFVREGSEENAIDNAEDYGRRTDAERQCDNRGESEAAVFPQAPQRESNVAD